VDLGVEAVRQIAVALCYLDVDAHELIIASPTDSSTDIPSLSV
jgi:hypothetical protein